MKKLFPFLMLFPFLLAVNVCHAEAAPNIREENSDSFTATEYKIYPTDDGDVYNEFGRNSVSISGGYAIVGGTYLYYASSPGSVHIFERRDSSWNQVAKLTASDEPKTDYFGLSVSISGEYAIVGSVKDNDKGFSAGAAYIFERSDSGWNQVAKLTASDGAAYDYFGYSVSISGEYAIVGAFGDDDKGLSAGAAYIFKRNDSGWNQVAKLTASDGAAYDGFGNSVSISGAWAIVGAPWDDVNGTDSGSAYIFDFTLIDNNSTTKAMPWIPLLLTDD